MQRYRHAQRLLLGVGLLLAVGGCSAPTQRENLAATARLVVGQVAAPLEWRLDPKADAEARQRAESLLADGLTLEEAVLVSFLASPELQLALEKIEISRADFVAAATLPNPVLVLGSREPNGALAAFYPERTVTIGVLESVIDLLSIPDRRGIARHDLARARYEAANSAVRLAAEVAQAWIDYTAALQVRDLRERVQAILQLSYDNLRAAQAGGEEISDDTIEAERRELLVRKGDVIRATLDVARARTKLGEVLGIIGWRDDWSVLQTLPALPASDPDPVAEEHSAMERRLDLLAANETVDGRLRLLAHQRRFRWLNQLDLGLFRDQATGGTTFTGPNAVIEIPFFDQRLAAVLTADSQLRSELRSLDEARLTARGQIRNSAAEMVAARGLVEQVEREIQPGQRQQQASPAGGDPDDVAYLKLRLDILAGEEARVLSLRDYWRARSALALAAGDWGTLSGLR